jgi:hypothetical protein
MTSVPPLTGRCETSTQTDPGIGSDGYVVANDHEVIGPDGNEDSNFSVAGEEDPGAALDLNGPSTNGTEAWCPWPALPCA